VRQGPKVLLMLLQFDRSCGCGNGNLQEKDPRHVGQSLFGDRLGRSLFWSVSPFFFFLLVVNLFVQQSLCYNMQKLVLALFVVMTFAAAFASPLLVRPFLLLFLALL